MTDRQMLLKLAGVVAARTAGGGRRTVPRGGLRALDGGTGRTVGLARVVPAVPGLALAIGYDIDAALEGVYDFMPSGR